MEEQLVARSKKAVSMRKSFISSRLGQLRHNLGCMEPWIIEQLEAERKKRERQEAERPRVELPEVPPKKPEAEPKRVVHIQL